MQSHLVELRLDGINHLGMTVTDVENAESTQAVEIATSLVIEGIDAFVSELNGTFGAGKLLPVSCVEVINRICEGVLSQLLIIGYASGLLDHREALTLKLSFVYCHDALSFVPAPAVRYRSFEF
ncbi:MAG: hypothetical protein BWY75_02851 [bacterium ADurb.Bin425]|nr:MAG: hypothetical protein BWY75_02851 [bacterium ADurb.Bin425]